jgi:Cys-tRNA(Pro)/Cys-tRNA(Cys) deacylase
METKTNVMRMLDKMRIKYKTYFYDPEKYATGIDIATALNQNPAQVFKTLVTINKQNNLFVFMLPVNAELNLKSAAMCVGEKSLNMLPQRELLGRVGYVHGGCSPIGMKKVFTTVLDASAQNFETIIFSAGIRGAQVEISPNDLNKIVPIKFSNICE